MAYFEGWIWSILRDGWSRLIRGLVGASQEIFGAYSLLGRKYYFNIEDLKNGVQKSQWETPEPIKRYHEEQERLKQQKQAKNRPPVQIFYEIVDFYRNSQPRIKNSRILALWGSRRIRLAPTPTMRKISRISSRIRRIGIFRSNFLASSILAMTQVLPPFQPIVKNYQTRPIYRFPNPFPNPPLHNPPLGPIKLTFEPKSTKSQIIPTRRHRPTAHDLRGF